MGTRVEFYQRLREHIPEEAARMIAEEMSSENELRTRLDLLATREELGSAVHAVEISVEKLRSSMFRWNLVFFVPLWIGVYATLVAILLRGSP